MFVSADQLAANKRIRFVKVLVSFWVVSVSQARLVWVVAACYARIWKLGRKLVLLWFCCQAGSRWRNETVKVTAGSNLAGYGGYHNLYTTDHERDMTFPSRRGASEWVEPYITRRWVETVTSRSVNMSDVFHVQACCSNHIFVQTIILVY